MLRRIRNIIKGKKGTSTLEFIVLLPIYFIVIWIMFEALFFYNYIVFDGFAKARNEVLEQCYKSNSETVKTFSVKGGIPIISDLIDVMTIFFPDHDQLNFTLSGAGN